MVDNNRGCRNRYMKKSSVKEIARLAGVSIGTVDRVLHDRGRVAKKTEEKVREIIKSLNYKPDVFARNLKLSKAWDFGVLMPGVDQDSRYWQLPHQGIEGAVRELSPLKIKVHYFFFDKYDNNSFCINCEKALKADLDGLIIAPVLGKATEKFIDCIPGDLPYVFFDSFVPGAKPLAVIGQDSMQAGRLAASLMCLLLPNGGEVAVIRSLPWDYHIEKRISGFRNYFKSRKHFTLTVYDMRNHQNGTSFGKTIRQIRNNHGDLKGLFVSNANTYPFARSLRSTGSTKKVAVIGFDLIRENVQLLKSGQIDFLISQRPKTQGYQSIYSLYRHVILNEPVEKELFMSLEIITKENIEESSIL